MDIDTLHYNVTGAVSKAQTTYRVVPKQKNTNTGSVVTFGKFVTLTVGQGRGEQPLLCTVKVHRMPGTGDTWDLYHLSQDIMHARDVVINLSR